MTKSHGYVKTRVRKLTLLLDEFTAKDLANITSLKLESIRTEIGKLKREGFIINTTPGEHEAVYALTDDLEKRMELSNQVTGMTSE